MADGHEVDCMCEACQLEITEEAVETLRTRLKVVRAALAKEKIRADEAEAYQYDSMPGKQILDLKAELARKDEALQYYAQMSVVEYGFSGHVAVAALRPSSSWLDEQKAKVWEDAGIAFAGDKTEDGDNIQSFCDRKATALRATQKESQEESDAKK